MWPRAMKSMNHQYSALGARPWKVAYLEKHMATELPKLRVMPSPSPPWGAPQCGQRGAVLCSVPPQARQKTMLPLI